MRNNYNIKLNPRPLSGEDIEKHQDFDALLSQYRQSLPAPRPGLQPLRLLMYAGGAVAAAVVGLLIYFGVLQIPGDRPAMTSDQYFASREFVDPPLANAGPRFVSHTINASEGGSYDFEGGSRLVIPSEAFMDDRGRLIEGEVDIHYREMHDFIDFFLAGIPMTYDSAGQRYYMEPAGMVEIFALQEGRRVNLAPGKAIEVELVSEITVPDGAVAPRYQIYWLDTTQRHWVFEEVEHIQLAGETPGLENTSEGQDLPARLRAIDARAAAEIANLEKIYPMPPAPVKPPRKEKGKASFENELITEAARAIDGLMIPEGAVWQVSPRSSSFDISELGKHWDDFRIRQLNGIEFELTLINPGREVKAVILPVLSGDQYDRAMRRYENDFAAYQQAQVERESKIAGRRQDIEEAAAREKAAAQGESPDQSQGTDNANALGDTEGRKLRIVNRFRATKLGIWNCDKPRPLDGEELHAGFVDQHGHEYDNHTIYLVNQGHNTVFRFYSGDKARLKIDPESIIWAVSDDNRIALLRSPEVYPEKGSRKAKMLVLKLVDQQINNEADVRKILRFD